MRAAILCDKPFSHCTFVRSTFIQISTDQANERPTDSQCVCVVFSFVFFVRLFFYYFSSFRSIHLLIILVVVFILYIVSFYFRKGFAVSECVGRDIFNETSIFKLAKQLFDIYSISHNRFQFNLLSIIMKSLRERALHMVVSVWMCVRCVRNKPCVALQRLRQYTRFGWDCAQQVCVCVWSSAFLVIVFFYLSSLHHRRCGCCCWAVPIKKNRKTSEPMLYFGCGLWRAF